MQEHASLEQRTSEWHSARRGRITGSIVGAILGNSPWMDRDDAMRTLVRAWHGAESEFTGNVATEYGNFHEEYALADYVMETGNAVEKAGFLTRDDWAGASPDGLISLTGGVEFKCPYKFRHARPEDMPTPEFLPLAEQPHYYDQVQFTLWVTLRSWWDFVQWAPHLNLKIERVKPDSKWRTKNLPKLLQFYEEFAQVRDDKAASAPYLEPKRKVIDTPAAEKLLLEYDKLSEAIENATARKKELLEKIVEMAGAQDARICGRSLTKVEREGAVSYAKVVKEHLPKLDLKPYRGKPSEYWQIK
jgi:putative phage-type endonuclease